jgi:hypothetical protein
LKAQIKEQICSILVNRYKESHNGEFPNWEDGEEIVLTEDDFFVNVVVWNTYDEYSYNELQEVHKCIVTLDYNLYFIVGEDENEYDWSEIGIDDLAKLLDHLNEKFN